MQLGPDPEWQLCVSEALPNDCPCLLLAIVGCAILCLYYSLQQQLFELLHLVYACKTCSGIMMTLSCIHDATMSITHVPDFQCHC